ncbi:MAG: LLM class flavin-dependent oxidoreductase [Pseudomonadota bacterium]
MNLPQLVLRLDLRNPAFGASTAALYEAALDMSVWAEHQGFYCVQLSEHHASADGYLPSPLVLAAAVAARTHRIRIRIALIPLPLNNPLKLAEDLAVLDQVSQGRLEVVLGAGYVPEEFEMFGVSMGERGRLMEEGIEAITQAWLGEPFDYRGRRALVRPRPVQQPRPPLWLGGNSPAAAKRAARLADYFLTYDPTLYQIYRDTCQSLGHDPGPWGDCSTGFLVASPDVDAEWQRMAPYLLHECNAYGRWQAASDTEGQYQEISDPEMLRETGLYPILSAEAARAHLDSLGARDQVCLHPLVSGFPPEFAWQQLEYFAEAVWQPLQPPSQTLSTPHTGAPTS